MSGPGWWGALLDFASQAVSTEKTSAVAVSARGGVKITGGELRSAIAALKAFDVGSLETAVRLRLADVADDEAAADDVLSLVAAFVPQAALLEDLVKVGEVVVPLALANWRAHPIVNPEVEANAYSGRGGRGN
ncbi:MAG TPA: hypothetical protein VGF57_09915 [Roseiarcus sp.]